MKEREWLLCTTERLDILDLSVCLPTSVCWEHPQSEIQQYTRSDLSRSWSGCKSQVGYEIIRVWFFSMRGLKHHFSPLPLPPPPSPFSLIWIAGDQIRWEWRSGDETSMAATCVFCLFLILFCLFVFFFGGGVGKGLILSHFLLSGGSFEQGFTPYYCEKVKT